MDKIIEMKQERAKIIAQARGVLEIAGEEKRELLAAENEKYENMLAEAEIINGKITREERQLELEKMSAEDPQEKETAETDKMSAIRNYLKGGSKDQYMMEARALGMSDPEQSGYLVAPQQFGSQVIKGLDNTLFVRNKATKFQLKGAQSLGFPKRTARAAGASWGTEISAASEDTSLKFGLREFMPHYLTDLIKVSKPLLLNSAINAEKIVIDELIYDIAEVMEQAYLTGDGVNKPLGMFTASADGISTSRDVTSSSATALTADVLLDAKYALKGQYRKTSEWIFNKDAVKQITKLKNGDGTYMWMPSLIAGQPDKLLGHSINESEYAPNTFTSGNYVGMLANMAQYWISDSLAVELQRLNELYATTNQIGILFRAQTDGMPVVEEAFSRIKLG